MKKVITSLMLICILFISSTISVRAWVVVTVVPLPASSVFEGSGYIYDPQNSLPVYIEVCSLFAVTDEDSNVTLDITLPDGTTTQYVLYVEYDEWGTAYYQDSDGTYMTRFNLEDDGDYGMARSSDFHRSGKLTMVSTADFIGTKVIGTTTTSTAGEYMVVVGGSISGTYLAGRHEVTDVASQPLTIMGVNLTNGTVVILDTSSIDSMYVTVIGGQITKVEIEGHLQTSPGNFDTYSIVI